MMTVDGSMYMPRTRQFGFLFAAAFRPCVLGFLCLAVAIAAWGFGYKISLYQPNSGIRSTVAKLWDKQHNARTTADVLNQTKLISDLTYLVGVHSMASLACPRPAVAHLPSLPRVFVSLASVDYRLPFRSPPLKIRA